MKKIALLGFAAVLTATAFAATPPKNNMWCGVTISSSPGCYTTNQPITLVGQTYAATDWDDSVHYKWRCSSDGGVTWVNLLVNNDTCIVTLWGVTSDLLFTFSAKEKTISMPAYPFGEITSPSVLVKRCTGPLPITLLSFSGEHVGTTNVIRWETALEINVDHFVLQRSVNGVVFTSVNDSIIPHGIGIPYRVEDNVGPLSKLYYYRLMVVNRNETVSNGTVIKVAGNEKASGITLLPNPARSYIDIGPGAMRSGDIITIVDIAGRTVLSSSYGTGRIDISRLVTGMYFTKIQGQSLQFIKN